MNPRRTVKIAVDAALYGLMLALMGYPFTLGLLLHGVCGAAFLALLLGHHALNRGWYRALGRGRWNARRVLLTATDAGLMLGSAALIASSLAMAGEVFSFVPFPMTWWGRGVHTAATAWCFVLASFHLGLHGQRVWSRMQRVLGRVWPAVVVVLLAFGGVAFVESRLWSDMVLLGWPKIFPETPAFFLARFVSVTLAFCLLARVLLDYLERARRR